MSDSHAPAGFLAPDPAELNELFPGYEIDGLIATGGMGAVYCAVQKSLDRTVALKILPQEFSKDAGFCEAFEAEAKAMARLNHPNLIGVYDFGEVNGMLFIIMEYVPGKSLYHSAHGQAIDPGEVNRLVTGICNGLAHAHENGIIHRDIKPSNILLDLNAQPKIGDFGLARPIERKVQEGEEIFGTPHYTAPEVVDHPQSVDYRSDIFSVGVLLHELLTGKLPADDPRPPSVISRCDPRFDVIVRRATHIAPAGRYSSVAEMAKDLAIIAASSGPRAVHPGVAANHGPGGPRVAGPIKARRPVKIKKSSHSPVLIKILLLAAIGFGAYVYLTQQQPPVKAVPVEPKNATPAQPIQVTEPSETTEQPVVPDPESEMPPQPRIPVQPAHKPAIELSPDPEPEVIQEPSAPALPKFDVTGFFAKARKIMQDRAKPYLTAHEADLKSNFTSFERTLKRQARKLKDGRIVTENRLEIQIATWERNGSTIPQVLDDSLSDIPDAQDELTKHLEKESAIEEAFLKSLIPLATTYNLGLEKQVERLKLENDTPAIELIQREIELTKQSPKHFADLIMEIDP
ncbi:MAG: protein kinase [Luteolibacter sp.]